MCDTLGRLGSERSLFAKNSDRSPNETQLLEYHPARRGLSGSLKCTYTTVDQVTETHGVLLSRPGWMWGGEMGINDQGLCIGNEAVFTRGPYGKAGLTGMDMVRLALERCDNAHSALELLIELLETHGQGGNCGFDHDFYYDNGFLIMDRRELYVLETAGKRWTWRQSDRANISNRLSLGAEADACSEGVVYDFRKRHTEPVYTTFSGSKNRFRQIESCLSQADTVSGCIRALRSHDRKVTNPFAMGSVSSACMHYGGLVGDHTTASMVVSLETDRTVVWSAGSSVPCVSLFKPWLMGSQPVLPVTGPEDPQGKSYWLAAEDFRRSLLGKKLPRDFYDQRNALEAAWLGRSESLAAEDYPAFSRECLNQEREFYDHWRGQRLEQAKCAPGFRSRWEAKNKELEKNRESL